MDEEQKKQMSEVAQGIKETLTEAGYQTVESGTDTWDLLFNPARRGEMRRAFGLHEDGKEWCAACQQAHEPPIHS